MKCLLTQNDCYKTAQKRPEGKEVKGVIVHSTGANNPWLKRYVQPSQDDPNYSELLAAIGTNIYGNSWNRPGISKAVHFMIGRLADGTVADVQTLPLDICCWGCGKGSKGSYNYNPAYIQIEILEDDLKDKAYLEEVQKVLIDLLLRLNPTEVIDHKEAYNRGYASNHSDVSHWFNIEDIRKGLEEAKKKEQEEVLIPIQLYLDKLNNRIIIPL